MTAVHTYRWGDGRTLEAVQLTLHNIDAVEEFVGGDGGVHPEGGLVFATTNGPLRATIGDYILKYDAGVYERLSAETFRAVYPRYRRIESETST